MVEATNVAFDAEAIINEVLRRPTWGRLAHEPGNHDCCRYGGEVLSYKEDLGNKPLLFSHCLGPFSCLCNPDVTQMPAAWITLNPAECQGQLVL